MSGTVCVFKVTISHFGYLSNHLCQGINTISSVSFRFCCKKTSFNMIVHIIILVMKNTSTQTGSTIKTTLILSSTAHFNDIFTIFCITMHHFYIKRVTNVRILWYYQNRNAQHHNFKDPCFICNKKSNQLFFFKFVIISWKIFSNIQNK